MANAQPSAPPTVPSKGGIATWLFFVIGLVAVAAGFALPLLLTSFSMMKPAPVSEGLRAFVPFGDVVVNLAEERLTRYLRVKIMLLVDAAQEKAVIDQVQKQKFILKSWLISYLSDKSLQEVSGRAGVERARREIQDYFNSRLFPDGSEKIRDVLFEEFNVQ
jgi:flagellar FliL protein